MNYTEILNALPKDVSTILQITLDNTPIESTTSNEEIFNLFNSVIESTKLQMNLVGINLDSGEFKMVSALLSLVPSAGVKMIIGS